MHPIQQLGTNKKKVGMLVRVRVPEACELGQDNERPVRHQHVEWGFNGHPEGAHVLLNVAGVVQLLPSLQRSSENVTCIAALVLSWTGLCRRLELPLPISSAKPRVCHCQTKISQIVVPAKPATSRWRGNHTTQCEELSLHAPRNKQK
jgi:hypothetical protein